MAKEYTRKMIKRAISLSKDVRAKLNFNLFIELQ
jgi:hypothetical protein